MNIGTMINLQLVLLLCMGCGIVLGRKGILTEKGKGELTELIMTIALPANIISSFAEQELSRDLMKETITILVISTMAQVLAAILGYLMYPKRWFSEGKRKVLRYSTINSNAGFIALPIIWDLLGAKAAMLASIALIPVRICLWSFGIAIFVSDQSTKEKVRKIALHPTMIAVYIGLAIMFLPFDLPQFLLKTLDTVGSSTTFLSMLVVGLIVSRIDFKSVLSWGVFYFSAIRLLVIPLIWIVVLRLCGIDEIMIAVIALMVGAPAGSFTAILASKYHCEEQFASGAVLVSTLLFAITMPLLCLLI